jgi:D-alanyl-D-alanine carboxypeptidase (penicillin-binding protein 5/6)
MLTSIISLYIASATMPITETRPQTPNIQEVEIVKTASSSLQSLIDSKPAPIKKPQYISPVINSKSAISVDLDSGAILYEKNPHQRLPIASITKLMTMSIILEENDLNEIAKVSNYAANIEGSQMYLYAGEEMTVENLLYGAIIASANDAAITLAEHNAGNVDAFVEKMNKKAKEIGLLNTHFSNPIGLDQTYNYSTAYDIVKLSKYAYQNEFIKKAAIIKELNVQSINGTSNHKLESTNLLLDSYLKIKGLKTGSTDLAGECLVAITENETGNEIFTVVLNSPSRFTETKILADWSFRAYNWQN